MAPPRLDDLLLLIVPAIAVIATWWHHARVTHGRLPTIRPLTGLPILEDHLSEGVESGKPLHIATGSSRPGTLGITAESLASLEITDRLAELVTRRGGSLSITNGDIVNHLATRGILRRVYRQTGLSQEYQQSHAVLVAHQTPIAYAAGVAGRFREQPMDINVVLGDTGDETLLISEEGNHYNVPQVSGSTSLSALPALTLSTTATLVGEELFAAEAYLAETDAPKARLLTLDALRWLVVLLIIVAIVYRLLDATLGLGLPAL